MLAAVHFKTNWVCTTSSSDGIFIFLFLGLGIQVLAVSDFTMQFVLKALFESSTFCIIAGISNCQRCRCLGSPSSFGSMLRLPGGKN